MMIVTDKAAAKIKSLVEAEDRDPADGLRIGVTGGGCSGFQYVMEIGGVKEGDQVFQNGPARVFIDPKSLLFVDGSAIDYNDGLTNAGFVIQNPKSTGTCGCGLSFSV